MTETPRGQTDKRYEKAYAQLKGILAARGISGDEAIAEYLSDKPKETYDPFLLPDMDAGVDFVLSALKENKKICIFGDYDVDGVTATALLYLFLEGLGACLSYYIPRRSEEGYGLTAQAIDAVRRSGADVVITVDCGAVSSAEVRYAREAGLEIMITDHHDLIAGERPDCILIDPKRTDAMPDGTVLRYPFPYLSGCGTAFKLAQAVMGRLGENGEKTPAGRKMLASFVDLVAVSTIADVMPLTGENRTFVKYGMRLIRSQRRKAFSEILNNAAIAAETASERDIAFGVAPRINALGRMGDASAGVELFISRDPAKIAEIAAEMEVCNTKRRAIQDECFSDCLTLLETDRVDGAASPECPHTGEGAHPDDAETGAECADGKGGYRHSFQLLRPERYHEGVSGIVAGRIKGICGLPSAVLAPTDAEDGEPALKGSARSAGRLELTEMLNGRPELFMRLGGHGKASGFTIRESDEELVRELISADIDALLEADPGLLDEDLDIDLTASPADLSLELAEMIEKMAPFGEGNAKPVLKIHTDAESIASIYAMGRDGLHARFLIKTGDCSVKGVYFGGYEKIVAAVRRRGDIDLIAVTEINTFGGREELRLNVKELLHPRFRT
ncbi:MAG: single-stranded-DNA-specific exonuclease RecJ [Clostridiales Family XIII bacterium]|jgi:single-stranded-DNA-specific exonuclease|nr:single-stranded-DNA-specific exonuclease RecJ [Clostridiales Family XIII bacterium]